MADSEESTDQREEKKLTVHIIDPDKNAINMLTMILGNMDNLSITTQDFKDDLFTKIKNAGPDFLILELPGNNGPEFYEELPKDRVFARTKFIVCSTDVESPESRAYLRRLRPERVYRKPLDAAKFIREFKHLITLKLKQKGWKSSYG